MKKEHMIKADPGFVDRFLDEIKVQRIKSGIDKKMISNSRITAALRRHPKIRGIKEDIIKADLSIDRRETRRNARK